MRLFFLLILVSCTTCTNDRVIELNKTGFTNIYKNILLRTVDTKEEEISAPKTAYNKKWLSKFNQPIIGLSSPNQTEKATLVALGNHNDKLTWVSADGISVSFANGILIATRGYSQDLMESKHSNLNAFFTQHTKNRKKTYRYLNGENRYRELKFNCSITAKANSVTSFLTDLRLETTIYTEFCESDDIRHNNEYYVLPNTNIILKSKQWISESNGYITVHNYYAFQNN